MHNCVWKTRPKNTSGGPSGDPFWDPKWPQIDVGNPTIAKISGKSRFFDRPFFDRFFKHRKNRKKKREIFSLCALSPCHRSPDAAARGSCRPAERKGRLARTELGDLTVNPAHVLLSPPVECQYIRNLEKKLICEKKLILETLLCGGPQTNIVSNHYANILD